MNIEFRMLDGNNNNEGKRRNLRLGVLHIFKNIAIFLFAEIWHLIDHFRLEERLIEHNLCRGAYL